MKIEKFQYPDYVNFNKKIFPVFLEWSKTKEDFRENNEYHRDRYDQRVKERITYFDMNKSWHSEDNLQDNELLKPLKDFILETTKKTFNKKFKFLTMWTIITRKYSKGEPHSHRGSYSGIYYVNNGCFDDDNITGCINFEMKDGVKKVKPRDGDLLFFPSDTVHYVDEYLGDGNRVVISFNLMK